MVDSGTEIATARDQAQRLSKKHPTEKNKEGGTAIRRFAAHYPLMTVTGYSRRKEEIPEDFDSEGSGKCLRIEAPRNPPEVDGGCAR